MNPMRPYALLLTVITCLCSTLSHADWPDWRGPTADGHSDATLPLHWSETDNIAWKTAIHDFGLSTPVVLGDQVWLTTSKEDGTVLYAVCIDLNSGAVTHDIPVFEIAEPQRINPLNSYATPSAVIESGRVYVHYGTFGTACIDTKSGVVLWRRTDLNCDHMQGPASSPVLFEDLVIITVEGVDQQFMAALDKRDGTTVWMYKRPEEFYTGIQGVYLKSYQTPVILEIEGQPQLVSNGALLVTGHNPRTGEEIWRARYKDDSTISRIIQGDGVLFINTGGPPGGTELWAIKEGGQGDVTDSHVVWKMTEDVPHESSPVLVGDLLYTMSDPGTLKCLEATTGNVVWTMPMKVKYSASLLATTDRIYLSNKKGTTTIIAPGREYKELATNQLDGEIWASPAIAGDSLLLRTKTHLYRIAETK
jgi:outer membrane protein assembly factor BamB